MCHEWCDGSYVMWFRTPFMRRLLTWGVQAANGYQILAHSTLASPEDRFFVLDSSCLWVAVSRDQMGQGSMGLVTPPWLETSGYAYEVIARLTTTLLGLCYSSTLSSHFFEDMVSLRNIIHHKYYTSPKDYALTLSICLDVLTCRCSSVDYIMHIYYEPKNPSVIKTSLILQGDLSEPRSLLMFKQRCRAYWNYSLVNKVAGCWFCLFVCFAVADSPSITNLWIISHSLALFKP